MPEAVRRAPHGAARGQPREQAGDRVPGARARDHAVGAGRQRGQVERGPLGARGDAQGPGGDLPRVVVEDAVRDRQRLGRARVELEGQRHGLLAAAVAEVVLPVP
ncbi:hypothetical protein RB200_39365 [Streptomyces sp. PmtG]